MSDSAQELRKQAEDLYQRADRARLLNQYGEEYQRLENEWNSFFQKTVESAKNLGMTWRDFQILILGPMMAARDEMRLHEKSARRRRWYIQADPAAHGV